VNAGLGRAQAAYSPARAARCPARSAWEVRAAARRALLPAAMYAQPRLPACAPLARVNNALKRARRQEVPGAHLPAAGLPTSTSPRADPGGGGPGVGTKPASAAAGPVASGSMSQERASCQEWSRESSSSKVMECMKASKSMLRRRPAAPRGAARRGGEGHAVLTDTSRTPHGQ